VPYDELKELIKHKEAALISGTGAAIWSKTNFGPPGHHHPGSSLLPLLCAVPRASGVFKCILKVVFCEGVQYRLRFRLDHLSCFKMAAFQFYPQSGKQRKARWMEDDNYIVFGKKGRKNHYIHPADTDSKDMLALSFAVASRGYNGCRDGSTSPENYGYSLYSIKLKKYGRNYET
jgi:hypothetical protein